MSSVGPALPPALFAQPSLTGRTLGSPAAQALNNKDIHRLCIHRTKTHRVIPNDMELMGTIDSVELVAMAAITPELQRDPPQCTMTMTLAYCAVGNQDA